MLPAGLLVCRLQGERIVPSFLGELDHPWLRALLDERERFVGRPRREFAARSKEPLRTAAPRRKCALAAHVLERLAHPACKGGTAPRQIRSELFRAAAVATVTRGEVLAQVAAQLGMTSDALEAGLFGDLPDLQPLPALVRPIAPVDLAARANLALAQGILARADRVIIEIEGNALPIVRRAKLRGLIVNVGVTGTQTRLELSGPLSLFHHTRVYGRALGGIVPLLSWCARFQLDAGCILTEGSGNLRLASGDPIFPADEPVRFDSELEADFARKMGKAAPDWDLIRDPQPLEAGDGLVFPDFVLVHREDGMRRWLIEIVGYWTPEYLARKLAAYRAASAPNLVLCIDERRQCSDGDLPSGARVVWFRRRIAPQAVLEAISGGRLQKPEKSEKPERTAATPTTDVPAPRGEAELLVDAIRDVASRSPYGNAFLPLVQRKLGRRIDLAELISLCRSGHVALNRPTADVAVRPLAPPRFPISVTRAAVEASIAAAIEATRRDERPPLYHLVRERFDWLAPDGRDQLRPIVEAMARERVIALDESRGRTTIDVTARCNGVAAAEVSGGNGGAPEVT